MEIRLLNEKSDKIKIGEKIKFQVINSDLFLIVEVTNKYIYSSVDELWKDKDVVLNSARKYTKEEFLKAMFEIFGEEKVRSSEIVGIEFKLLDESQFRS